MGSLAPRRFGRDCVTSVLPLIPSRPFVKWACYRVVYNEVRISELLQQTRFECRADLETTLLNYLKLYNHHIPQRSIGAKTPIQALKEWQQTKPELFVKRVYDQTGLDTYQPSTFFQAEEGK